MEKDMQGKVALVTGAGSGIGEATALLYARHGAKVVVSDINEEGGHATVDKIKAGGGEAIFVKTDVSKPEDCENMIQATLDNFGKLDMACNNAGIGGEQGPVGEMSIENWKHVMAVNLDSIFYCMKYEINAMLKNGGGSIANISSILGSVGFAGASAYTASKHGMIGLTKNVALDYATQGIRANTIGPAFIDTPLLAGLDDKLKQMLNSLHPVGHIGKAEDVAEIVVWITGDKAKFVTGSYYPVDGGYLAQ